MTACSCHTSGHMLAVRRALFHGAVPGTSHGSTPAPPERPAGWVGRAARRCLPRKFIPCVGRPPRYGDRVARRRRVCAGGASSRNVDDAVRMTKRACPARSRATGSTTKRQGTSVSASVFAFCSDWSNGEHGCVSPLWRCVPLTRFPPLITPAPAVPLPRAPTRGDRSGDRPPGAPEFTTT